MLMLHAEHCSNGSGIVAVASVVVLLLFVINLCTLLVSLFVCLVVTDKCRLFLSSSLRERASEREREVCLNKRATVVVLVVVVVVLVAIAAVVAATS